MYFIFFLENDLFANNTRRTLLFTKLINEKIGVITISNSV